MRPQSERTHNVLHFAATQLFLSKVCKKTEVLKWHSTPLLRNIQLRRTYIIDQSQKNVNTQNDCYIHITLHY